LTHVGKDAEIIRIEPQSDKGKVFDLQFDWTSTVKLIEISTSNMHLNGTQRKAWALLLNCACFVCSHVINGIINYCTSRRLAEVMNLEIESNSSKSSNLINCSIVFRIENPSLN